MSQYETLVRTLMADCALPYGHAIGVLEVLRQNGVQVSMEGAGEAAPSIPDTTIPDTTIPDTPQKRRKRWTGVKHSSMTTGQFIALRKILDESQSVFAMRIGTAPHSISRVESCEETKKISSRLLNKIYEAGIDPELIEAARQRAEREPEPQHTATVNRLPQRDAR